MRRLHSPHRRWSKVLLWHARYLRLPRWWLPRRLRSWPSCPIVQCTWPSVRDRPRHHRLQPRHLRRRIWRLISALSDDLWRGLDKAYPQPRPPLRLPEPLLRRLRRIVLAGAPYLVCFGPSRRNGNVDLRSRALFSRRLEEVNDTLVQLKAVGMSQWRRFIPLFQDFGPLALKPRPFRLGLTVLGHGCDYSRSLGILRPTRNSCLRLVSCWLMILD